jgi:hypothetical protein
VKFLLYAYYILFVLDTHPKFMTHGWQRAWVYTDARQVAFHTDASPSEGLRMMQIAKMESGFFPNAVGRKGECGAWQVLGGTDCSAKEALRRMRIQGMVAYVGCRHASDVVTLPEGTRTTCQEMIDNRIGPADRYLADHPPPPPPGDVEGEPVAAVERP